MVSLLRAGAGNLLERIIDDIEARRNRRIFRDPSVAEDPLRVEEEEGALADPVVLAKDPILTGHPAVRPEDALEREGEALFLGPGAVCEVIVDADPLDLRIVPLDFAVHFL